VPGIYISYPFCAQKCTYCNFASGVLPRALEPQYRTALLREIAGHEFQSTPDTVYLGGGTPSSMDPAALREILDALPGRPWAECTLETAPGTVTPESASAWRAAGVNRVSLGVQSFVEKELAQTGRRHRAATVDADVAILRAAGIANINIDLIAGLPFQTQPSWQESLDWIVRLDPPHVSIYMLEVDPDSRLGLEIIGEGSRYGAKQAPSDEVTAGLYETAVEFLAAHGITRYEISNFAKPGYESRHNLKYWRLEPYVGFGSDAHSFDGAQRWQNIEDAAAYSAAPNPRVETSASHPREEKFFVGLRLLDGVPLDAADWREHGAAIRRFLDAGLLERSGESIRLTNRGVLLSNEVFQEFLHP
jgi:oxygen-independent coproporphyrinogen III oxidase